MGQNKPPLPFDFRGPMMKIHAAISVVLVAAGIDAIFSKLVLKHTSPIVGGFLILMGIGQVPAMLRIWKKQKEMQSPQAMAEAMERQAENPTPFPAPVSEYSIAPIDEGMVIGQYTYKLANKLIGLVVSALLAAIGSELLFIHRFIPPRPETGFKVLAWSLLGIGAVGLISGIKSVLLPKPSLVVTENGLTTPMFGPSLTIPWHAIKSIKLSKMPNSAGRSDSLGMSIDPLFPLPKLFAMATMANQGELLLPLRGLNETPQKIYEQVVTVWDQYKPQTLQ